MVHILCQVGKVHRYLILHTDERRGMLDGYLTTGMAKWYVQYTVHEMDAQAGGGGNFSFSWHCARRCMHVSTQLPWQAAENASSSESSVKEGSRCTCASQGT